MNRSKTFFFTALIFISVNTTVFCADWIGPVNIFTTQLAQTPSVGIDAAGNAVILATASDNGTNFYEKGAQLIQGVVQNLHNYPSIGTGLFDNEYEPIIAVNAAGNAAGLWAEYDTGIGNDFVRAVILTNSIWGDPTTLTDVNTDNVQPFATIGAALDDSNHAIGTWVSVNMAQLIESSQYVAPNWSSVQLIPSFAEDPSQIRLAGSPSGTAVLAWTSFSYNIYSSYFNGATWATQLISADVYHTCTPLLSISMNANNTAALVWQNNSSSAINSTFIPQGVIGTIQTVYTPAMDESINALAVAIDNSGNAIAIWVSQLGATTYQVMTSRYTAGSWGAPIILDTTDFGNTFTDPNIAVDGLGNAYAVWEEADVSGSGTIFFNQYTKASNQWLEAPELLSTPGALSSTFPRLVMNEFGGATVVWSLHTEDTQSIQAVYILNQIQPVSPPNPPSNLTGKQLKTQLLTQTEYNNTLRWSASSTPTVVSYNVLRNGTLIATVPSTAPLVYQDHNRKRGVSYTYLVIAVDLDGTQSTAATTVVP